MAFNWLKNLVTGIPRFVGNAVQLKPRAALGALGDVLKPVGIAASAVPGPWQAAGIPLAAAGGAIQKFDDEGDRGIGDILGGAATGASLAAGAGTLSGLARSGYGALTGVGNAVAPTSALPAAPAINTAEAVTNTNAVLSGLPSAASSLKTAGSLATTAEEGNMFSGIGKYLLKHPEVPLSLAQTGVDMYGQSQQGAAMDRWQQIQQEQEAKRQKLAELQSLMQFVAGSMGRGY